MSDERVWKEEVRVQGEALVEKVKELVHEGNVRRVIVKNERGQTVMELPLTIGVVGAIAAPVIAAVGAIAALASKWTIEVERTGPKPKSTKKTIAKVGATAPK
jgi:hypothetical protein